MEFIWGWNIFQKFLNKLMTIKRERFWRAEIFFENFIPPLPLESQLDSPINAGFALHHRPSTD